MGKTLQDAWEAAGSPELVESEEPEEVDIPLEAEDLDEGIPVEDEEKPEAKGEGPESGTAESSEEDQWPEELPESYFGRNLKEYSEAHGLEATKAYYTALQDATKDYNRRLEELAEERKNLQQQPDQDRQQYPGDEEPDVETILREMGVNTTNPYAEEIKDDVLVPMARMIAELRQTQETSTSSAEADKFERDFFKGIKAAEEAFNEKLPLDDEQILSLAIDQDIYSPDALYRYVMAPIWEAERRHQRTEAKEAKATAEEIKKRAKKAASTAKGRRSSAPAATSKPIKKGSIEDAAKAAARSLGRNVVKFHK